MIIYRPHRGSLIDAMKEAKEFETLDEMKDYIVDDWDGFIKKDDIVLSEETHDDNRIGWKNVKHVCTKGILEYDGTYKDYIKLYNTPQCIGMCSEEYQ